MRKVREWGASACQVSLRGDRNSWSASASSYRLSVRLAGAGNPTIGYRENTVVGNVTIARSCWYLLIIAQIGRTAPKRRQRLSRVRDLQLVGGSVALSDR
jgi:hypothetical protein